VKKAEDSLFDSVGANRTGGGSSVSPQAAIAAQGETSPT